MLNRPALYSKTDQSTNSTIAPIPSGIQRYKFCTLWDCHVPYSLDKDLFIYFITWSQPAKLHSTKSQCLLFILSQQWRTAISRILMRDKFRLNTLMEASCKGLLMSKRLSCVLFHSTSSSRISVSVSWYSSSASSIPSVCLNHWCREPSMTASTRANPGYKDRPVIQRLIWTVTVKPITIEEGRLWRRCGGDGKTQGMSKKLGCGGRGYRCEEELIAKSFSDGTKSGRTPHKGTEPQELLQETNDIRGW